MAYEGAELSGTQRDALLGNPILVLVLAVAGALFGLVIMAPGSAAGDFFRTSGSVWLVLICTLMAASFLAGPAAVMTYRAIERRVTGGRPSAIVLAVFFLMLAMAPWFSWSNAFVPANPVQGIAWRFMIVVAVPVAVAFCAVVGVWRVQHGALAAEETAQYRLYGESLQRLTWILGTLIGLSTLTLGAYLTANDRPLLRDNLVKIAGQLAELRANPPTDAEAAAKASKELAAIAAKLTQLAPLPGEPPPADGALLDRSDPLAVCRDNRPQVQDDRLARAAGCVRAASSDAAAAESRMRRAAYDVDSVLRLIGLRPFVILVVGAYYTLLLGVSFVPAHLALQHAGRRIRDRTYPPMPLGADGFKGRLDERATADRLLGLDTGPGVALRQNVALLAPLAGGIISALLAGRL